MTHRLGMALHAHPPKSSPALFLSSYEVESKMDGESGNPRILNPTFPTF